MILRVNSWMHWGKLKTIVVGKADNACFKPEEAGFKGKINNEIISSELNCPVGKKKQSIINAANKQLDNLANILIDLGIKVFRPKPIDFSKTIKTPRGKCQICFVAFVQETL